MNKATLIGNIAREPELSKTPSGISLCKFTIAVNRNFTNANGERECDFLNIVAWRAIAENCAKYLKKGNKVAVSGSITNRSYEDNDGNKRYITEIIADDVEFLTPKSDGAPAVEPARKQPSMRLEPVESDDLPF